jgi:hypothetical protein
MQDQAAGSDRDIAGDIGKDGTTLVCTVYITNDSSSIIPAISSMALCGLWVCARTQKTHPNYVCYKN